MILRYIFEGNVYRMVRRSLVFWLCLTHVGCLPNYSSRSEVTVQILEDEIVGVWHLTEVSANMLREHNFLSASTESTLTLLETKRCLLAQFVCDEELVSEDCTWRMAHDLSQGRGAAKKNEVQIITQPSGNGGICRLSISREGNRLILWQYFGDPDRRLYVEYIRK
jgi:hypothetical protein